MKTFILKIASSILLIYSLVTIPNIILNDEYYPRIKKLESVLNSIHEENKRLKWEIEEKKRKIEQLRTEPEELKDVARKQFGFITRNEVVFIIKHSWE